MNSFYEETLTASDVIRECVRKLEKLAQEIQVSDAEMSDKISFVTEQLKLTASSSRSVKYSANLTLTAMTWLKTSPALYRVLKKDGRLSLPSVSYLRRLSSAYHLETGLSSATVAYLTQRIKALNEQEQNVSLQIDEVTSIKISCAYCLEPYSVKP